MGVIIGWALGIAWVVLGLATNWFGLPTPANFLIAFVGGLLCTAAFGPILANLSTRR